MRVGHLCEGRRRGGRMRETMEAHTLSRPRHKVKYLVPLVSAAQSAIPCYADVMRTRFAPSPTGYLHVGGLRTALYAYLLARKHGGTFLLRIEDTDQERSIAGAVESILASLAWARIAPDEGVMQRDGRIVEEGTVGPYVQSERQKLGIYATYAKQLLESGHAYPCFCTAERLDAMRKQQEARHQAPMYDRACLRLPQEEVARRIAGGEPHVLRMKIPHERTISYRDEIRTDVKFQASLIDDQVLVKSDGFPTYHLAHVVDDHLMGIDLVVRGEEWLSSLPKHLLLFEFLGWTPPKYAHVPLLLNANRTKLSKRENSVSVEEYIAKGYLPEALINFLALLGWNPGTTQELFSFRELIDAFALERVQKAGAIFDTTKLDWLQGQWVRRIPLEEFAQRIRPIVSAEFPQAASDDAFSRKAHLIQERITFFREAPQMLSFFYRAPTVTAELLANEKQKVTPDLLPEIFVTLESVLAAIPTEKWKDDVLLAGVKAVVGQGKWKLGQLLWPLRAALTGLPYSPGATEVAAALGKEETMERLTKAKK